MSDTAEQDLLRRIALPSFVGRYIGQEMWGEEYVVYPWIEYAERKIIEAIQDDTHERFIIINAPPQVGKSSYVGCLLPFWLTGMYPDKNLMYISYSDEFSEARAKDVRTCQKVWGQELFGTTIDPNHDRIAEWRISGHRGGMLSVGIGGLITGKPGHVIIIDDLIKNDEEASSTAAKKKHLSEWDKTINRRLQAGGTVIIIATRWAEDDLSGALIARMQDPNYTGPQWEVISFPAFAEPSEEMEGELTPEERATWHDIIGREFGEVLDCRFSRIPGRAPEDFFTIVKNSMDPFGWSCLYQQRPFSAEGSMFPLECWQTYDPDNAPDMEAMVRVWDLATTEGGGDWTVGTKMGRSDGKLYVLDVERFRHNSGVVLTKVKEVAERDGYGCKILVEEEKGGAGKTTVAALQKMLPTYNLDGVKAEGDKKSRATPWSSEQRNRRAHLPEDGKVPWDVVGFRKEHMKMMQDGRLPRHDDQIDTAAYAAADLIGGSAVEIWFPGDSGYNLSPEVQLRLLLGEPIVAGADA